MPGEASAVRAGAFHPDPRQLTEPPQPHHQGRPRSPPRGGWGGERVRVWHRVRDADR